MFKETIKFNELIIKNDLMEKQIQKYKKMLTALLTKGGQAVGKSSDTRTS